MSAPNDTPSGCTGNPARKLLVLDLDETLTHATEQALSRPADFQVGLCHVYLRPYLAEFITGVQPVFDLALWTAGGELYAKSIAERIFPEGALKFLWARNRCTWVRDWEQGGYDMRKNLKKVKAKGYPLASVIAIDDTPPNYVRSYGNLIAVRPYMGDQNDDELRLLLEFLRQINDVPDVRAIEKRGWREKTSVE